MLKYSDVHLGWAMTRPAAGLQRSLDVANLQATGDHGGLYNSSNADTAVEPDVNE